MGDWYFYAFLRNFKFHFYQTVNLQGWRWLQAEKLQYVQKPLKLKKKSGLFMGIPRQF